MEGATTSQEVFIWAEADTLDTADVISKEHEACFAKQGVAMTGKSASQDGTVYGVPAQFMIVEATWSGNRTLLQYVLPGPGPVSKWKLIVPFKAQ